MAEADHRVLGERLEGDPDKREEIGDRDGAALFIGRRQVLDECVDGDYEESAECADESEESGDCGEAEAGTERIAVMTMRPKRPGRIMPCSIFPAEAHPARKLPMPMPKLSAASK